MSKSETGMQHIAIIGGGFTGVALAAVLHRYAKQPVTIHLFEKSGQFGAGEAYRKMDHGQLLTVCAGEMSALADEPNQFERWLQLHAATYLDPAIPAAQQFVPCVLYPQYLCFLMTKIFRDESGICKLHLVPDEVTNLVYVEGKINLTTNNGAEYSVDQVVLAYGGQLELQKAAGNLLPACFMLGRPMKGDSLECEAVPEIRLQCKELAMKLLLHDESQELKQALLHA